MVLALDGDSTMTSLVPRPPPAVDLVLAVAALLPPLLALLALAVVPAFVLAGTLFPSSHPRRDRLTVLVVTRRPAAATIGPVRCVPSGSPEHAADLPPQVESPVNSSTI